MLGNSQLERSKLAGLGQDGRGALCLSGLASACLSLARVVVSVEWLAYGWVGTDSAGQSWTGRPQLVSAGYGWGRLSWTGFGLAGLVSVWIGSAEK